MAKKQPQSAIPKIFEGLNYRRFLSALSVKRSARNYLEIGVSKGTTLAMIHCDRAIAIDPAFKIDCNVAEFKKTVELYQEPSDTFFSGFADRFGGGLTFDLVFLDGMHLFEFLLRDFMNAEARCTPGSVIFMHDCLPLNERMAQRSPVQGAEDDPLKDFWTGDVWKILPILAQWRPDLSVTLIDCPPTGLVAVSNLQPDNRDLHDNYLAIVQAFKDVANSEENIAAIYSSFPIESSEKIINKQDHSLYFRI